MSWEELAHRYLEARRLAGRTVDTLVIDSHWLQFFMAAFRRDGVKAPVDARPSHIAALRQRLLWERGPHGRFYAANTVDQALRVVRSVFRWAFEERILLVDPAEHLVLPRPPRAVHMKLLSVPEVEAMLATPDPDTVPGMRDRAILETFYGTGVRLQECFCLDVEDVDLALRQLLVRHGKGQRQRVVPVGDALAEAMDVYLRESRPELLRRPTERALFLTYRGIRLQEPGLAHVVVRAGVRAGLPFPVGPHALRHAFATHLLEGGADLVSIGEMLGHTNLESTSIYTHVRPLEVQREHTRTHPRARRRASS